MVDPQHRSQDPGGIDRLPVSFDPPQYGPGCYPRRLGDPGHRSTPGDLEELRCWFGVVRQLRQVGQSRGLSIITLKVLVDADGTPVQWGKPRRAELSPLSGNDRFYELLERLYQDDPDAADRVLEALG